MADGKDVLTAKLDEIVPDDGHGFQFKTAFARLSSLFDAEMNPQAVILEIDAMIKELRSRLSHDPVPRQKIEILNKYIFEEKGYICAGNTGLYFYGKAEKEEAGQKDAAILLSAGGLIKNKKGDRKSVV
jgi:hypothetical protein